MEDVADLFNHLTGFARPPRYRRALVAPAHLRDGIVAEIDRAIAGHSAESPSRVVMKMNAIIDGPMIARGLPRVAGRRGRGPDRAGHAGCGRASPASARTCG